jgi:dihydroorotate dehydrogenase
VYKLLIRPLLFLIDAERIHHWVFQILKLKGKIPGFKPLLKSLFHYKDHQLKRNLFGLTFQNPVGLAAGFDKDALLVDELSCFGFGFIEIGTLTPRPQPGNDRPRLFRLPKDQALINRMGFNNKGVLEAAKQLVKRKSQVIVGGNIGRNKNTPNANASEDYAFCIEALFPYVDYFVVNVSSPNTPGLRELQEKNQLRELLYYVKSLCSAAVAPKPVLLKIAPDLTVQQLDDVIEILKETKTDGVIATNTTISRDKLLTSPEVVEKMGAGGLSGKPLADQSNAIIKYLRSSLGPDYPIIGVGGIMSATDAIEKLKAGADLIQIYTGFIYEGPSFPKKINKALVRNS